MNLRHVIRRMPALLLCSLILTSIQITVAQQADRDALRAASSLRETGERIRALREFLTTYPESNLKMSAASMLFQAYVDDGKEQMALQTAHEYLELIPLNGRTMAYNNVAWSLALKNIGLDSAIVYAERAESALRNPRSSNLNMVLDTKAYVLYRRGQFAEAKRVQEEAIAGHETDPEYLYHMAIIDHALGNRSEALRWIAKAILFGDHSESIASLDEWSQEQVQGSREQKELKRSVMAAAVDEYLAAVPADNLIRERSKASLALAAVGVELDLAERWARAAVASVTPSTPLEEELEAKKRLVTVLDANGKSGEALKIAGEIRDLVTPWEGDFWLTLGKIYEARGDMNAALEAYSMGLLGYPNPQVMPSFQRVYESLHGSGQSGEEYLEQLKESMGTFDPGHSDELTGRQSVVLAELFTGAECAPCQAADQAFDALSERYPRSSLAILEYHVHIPGPDPMTNPDTHDRYVYYGADFGTPTAIFNGMEKIIGGGPKHLAKNRFEVYRRIIEKTRSSVAPVTLSIQPVMRNDEVHVEVDMSWKTRFSQGAELALHAALAEKTVVYHGGNGVTHHLFVVRKLLCGPQGIRVTPGTEPTTVSQSLSVSLGDVETMIRSYLDDPTKHPSWGRRGAGFSGWKERPDTLNRENLAVVAWIQDGRTKEVIGAAYGDVIVGQ